MEHDWFYDTTDTQYRCKRCDRTSWAKSIEDLEQRCVKRDNCITLLDIPRESKIYESCSDGSKFFVFHHLDGMYSYCHTELGEVVHLSVFAELETFEDGYKFVPALVVTGQ